MNIQELRAINPIPGNWPNSIDYYGHALLNQLYDWADSTINCDKRAYEAYSNLQAGSSVISYRCLIAFEKFVSEIAISNQIKFNQHACELVAFAILSQWIKECENKI